MKVFGRGVAGGKLFFRKVAPRTSLFFPSSLPLFSSLPSSSSSSLALF